MKKLFLSTILLWCFNNNAKKSLIIEKWIEQEIRSQEKSLIRAQKKYSTTLSTVRIRLRATYGVEVPLLTKFKVRPEIELYWTKK